MSEQTIKEALELAREAIKSHHEWHVEYKVAAALIALAEQAEQAQRMIGILRAERDHSRAQYDSAIKRIVGIHLLLYPAAVTTDDGRTFVFRPKSPDPHEVLQELSDRIRALSDVVPAPSASKPKLAYYQTHEAPHCPTCGCGLTGAEGSVLDDVAKDAARYRWLRSQGCTFYTDDPVETVDMNADQKATKHHVCEWAMDAAIDAAMLADLPEVPFA